MTRLKNNNNGARRLLFSTAAILLVTDVYADDAASPPTPAPGGSITQVIVSGTPISGEDYRTQSVNSIGPLGTTPVLDTPYSIEILPQALIENSQATNFKDVSKYLPLVAYQEQQGPEILRPQTRGMQGGNFQNSKFDGMQMFITVATPMEAFQEIEVVNGLSASLYGPANPSGMFNFVSKRPTQTEQQEITASYSSRSISTLHADFSGPVDDASILSYRLNAALANGDGYVYDSRQRRTLGDLGVDVRPWSKGVIELNYSDYYIADTGFPGWFTYGETIRLPPAPDARRVGYGQEYAGVEMRTQIATARLRQDIGSDWHLIVGVLNQDASRNINTPVNNLTSNSGTYVSSFANGFAPRFVMTSETAYLNGSFSTWGLAHDLTAGAAGYKASSYSVITPASAASVRIGTANIYDPTMFPEPVGGPPNVDLNYDSSDTYQQGINFNDSIRFNPHWAIRVGDSQDWFHVHNFNTKGVLTSEYANEGLSPTGSLIFNPVPTMTTYFTYASSLQAGDLAPGTAANAGESLPPYRATEYEVGYKAVFFGINVTAALFDVERPFANINPADNVFEISGQQVNKGLELSAIGEIVKGLTVYGGLTLLNARLEHTPLPSTNDKTFVGAPKVKGNTLFEYQIPGISGLVAIFDYQFTGTRPGNDTNSLTVAGYNLFDVGARYASTLIGKPVTWRLSVDNALNRSYWSTIGPSDLTGTNTGNLLAHLGSPRMILASVSTLL